MGKAYSLDLRERVIDQGTSAYAPAAVFWVSVSQASIVNDANGRHLLRNVQSNEAGHRRRAWMWCARAMILSKLGSAAIWSSEYPPTVRITWQRRPDRGTIGRSSALTDYRMSIYVTKASVGTLSASRALIATTRVSGGVERQVTNRVLDEYRER